MSEDMLGLPSKVGAGAAGQRGGSEGAGSNVEAWGDTTSEFGEGPEPHVNTDQVGLPQADNAGPILEEG